jgi:ABC-type sugar transport system ATPase subunit
MASVGFEAVEKVYPGGTRGVSDVSLRVEDGELLVLVGPSGCGKTTLLRLLAGLEAPSAGTIHIGDRVVNDLPPQERNVAMVFQDYALYPHMTVRGNLEFPLRMRGLPRPEREGRVERVSRLLEMDGLLGRLPRQLSGGQRQRVAMGRALVREPAAFLLDEPLSNLDARLRTQVRAEIDELQRRTGTTMLYVTHDQVEAMTLGHRIAILQQGRLQQVATPEEVYARPATAFVAGFIGSPPMNLLPVRMARDAAGRPALDVAGTLLVLDGPVPLAAGQELVAGIRPEAVALAAGAGPGVLPARAEHSEYLGHETLVHARLEGDGAAPCRLVARLPGQHAVAPGGAVHLLLDPKRLHLFDADGSALS